MRILRCWARIIRDLSFKRACVALLALSVCAALLPSAADGASKKKSRRTTKASRSARTARKKPPPKAAAVLPGTQLQTLVRRLRTTPSAANRAALASYASRQKGTNSSLAFLALALADLEQKNFAAVSASIAAVRAKLPVLADYTAFWDGSAKVELGDFPGSVKALESIWSTSPDSPVLPAAALVAARAELARNSPGAAAGILRALEGKLPQPKGDALLAACLEGARDNAAAAVVWQKVYFDFPAAPEAADAGKALERLQQALGSAYPVPTTHTRLSRVGKWIDAREYSAARCELNDLIPELPAADRDEARVRMGAIDYIAGQASRALTYLRSLEVISAEADAERLYYIAAAYRRLNNNSEQDRTIDELSEKYPKSHWRLSGLILAGNNYLLENLPEKYEPFYREAADDFPGVREAAYGHWKVTWLRYLRRESDAETHLKDHLRRFPASEKASAALYYLGRLAQGKKKHDAARTFLTEAVSRFPNSYYALQARARLEDLPPVPGGPKVVFSLDPQSPKPEKRSIASGLDPDAVAFLSEIRWPMRDQSPSFDVNALAKIRMERARLLAAAGLDDWAESELKHGARSEGPAPLLAMELAVSASRRGNPDQGIRYIKSLVPGYLYVPLDAAPSQFWKLAFPLPFRSALESSARRYGLDPYRLAALIRQESEFNPKAVSRANAYGLTQVLPSTGRMISRRLGIRRFRAAMLYQPEVNLKIGTYYLKNLLDAFGGEWEPALASYNAGKSRVDSWLTWADYREPAEFAETIPFTETRDYVQIVIRNADVYRKLYGAGAAAVTSSNGSASAVRASP